MRRLGFYKAVKAARAAPPAPPRKKAVKMKKKGKIAKPKKFRGADNAATGIIAVFLDADAGHPGQQGSLAFALDDLCEEELDEIRSKIRRIADAVFEDKEVHNEFEELKQVTDRYIESRQAESRKHRFDIRLELIERLKTWDHPQIIVNDNDEIFVQVNGDQSPLLEFTKEHLGDLVQRYEDLVAKGSLIPKVQDQSALDVIADTLLEQFDD